MTRKRITEGSPWSDPRGQVMKTPDDVAEMMRLRACGWRVKRIARQLGCSHHTVKDYVAAGGVKPFKSALEQNLIKLNRTLRHGSSWCIRLACTHVKRRQWRFPGSRRSLRRLCAGSI